MNTQKIIFDNFNTFLPETLNDSFTVYGDCQDPVSQWMKDNNLLYEHNVIHLLKPLLQSSSVMVDIGSNIGCYSYYYRNYSNKNGHLICIDANSVNLGLLRQNCRDDAYVSTINAFWSCNNGILEFNSLEDLPIKKYFKDSLIKQKDTMQMPLSIKAIQNSELARLIQEKVNMSKKNNKGCPHYFVKIDVDGNEKKSAQELFNELRSANNNFFALVEVNHISTYYEIRNSGMVPKALLPGNNFLFASYNEQTLSDYYLSNTFSLISAYSNRWLDCEFKNEYDLLIDKREIFYRNRYGVSISKCRLFNKEWSDILKDEPIFAVYL